MRFPPHILDEIKSRLPVSRVVERRVKLKRAGREFIGLSPFKAERTPSFSVNDQKGFYHCFSSGEHGDIFSYIMKTEGLTFAESVERLAAEAGVLLPQRDKQDRVADDRRDRLLGAHECACQFFERALAAPSGEHALAYLHGRGLTQADIAAFRLGYAPEGRSALKSHLKSNGFTDTEIEEGGLVIHGDDIPQPYDRFRGRIMFPIADRTGRVIAFGGRALKPDQQPKYLNSPETPLFHKGHVLFNHAAAKEAARTTGELVVAEGYMDVIAFARAGVAHAVAPLGTALTEEQLRLVWSLAPNPILCFDGDGAGRKAAFRALDTALPHVEPGRSLSFAFLPDGQDPDDILRSEGSEALKHCLSKPRAFFEVMWQREQGAGSENNPEQRASLEMRLLQQASLIKHPTLRSHYTRSIKERLWAARRTSKPDVKPPAYDWRQRVEGPGFRPAKDQARSRPPIRAALSAGLTNSSAARGSTPSSQAREALIVRALLAHPWLIEEFAEDVVALPFENAICAGIRDRLLRLIDDEGSEGSGREQVESQCHALFEGIGHLLTHKSDRSFDPAAEKSVVIHAFRHILALHNAVYPLREALREAEEDYMRDQSQENFERVCALGQQMQVAIV